MIDNINILNFIQNINDKNNTNDPRLKISKAKQDYYDEYYTGLTEDEKKEIAEKAKAYIESHDMNDKNFAKDLADYIAGLLKKFGFKGDADEMASGMAMSAIFNKKCEEYNGTNNINSNTKSNMKELKLNDENSFINSFDFNKLANDIFKKENVILKNTKIKYNDIA